MILTDRAKESIEYMLAEQFAWFDKYVKIAAEKNEDWHRHPD